MTSRVIGLLFAGSLLPPMPRALRARGIVIGRDGRPLSHAAVLVRYRDVGRCRVRFDSTAEEQLTTEAGEFIFRHLDASHDFEIAVNHPEHSSKVIAKSDVLVAPLVGGVLRLTVPMKD